MTLKMLFLVMLLFKGFPFLQDLIVIEDEDVKEILYAIAPAFSNQFKCVSNGITKIKLKKANNG